MIEHLTDKDYLISKDGTEHINLGERIVELESELKSTDIESLNMKIKNNVNEINEIRNRLNGLQSFYDTSLLEVDYTFTKEKFEYAMATMLGE